MVVGTQKNLTASQRIFSSYSRRYRRNTSRDAWYRRFEPGFAHANCQQSVGDYRDAPPWIYRRPQCHYTEWARRAQSLSLISVMILVNLSRRIFVLPTAIAQFVRFVRPDGLQVALSSLPPESSAASL
jgi:hypothetical protein